MFRNRSVSRGEVPLPFGAAVAPSRFHFECALFVSVGYFYDYLPCFVAGILRIRRSGFDPGQKVVALFRVAGAPRENPDPLDGRSS